MPIKIPDQLPALKVLLEENIFAMAESRAQGQDIRPMEIGILNLMPNKIETEVQLLRLLSNSPLQVNVDLIRIDDRVPKNTPEAHMDAFYRSFDDIKQHKNYDGLIVTGAPLGLIKYEDVTYWPKMQEVMDWARKHVQSTLYLCWAAHASLYHYFGLARDIRESKISGVFTHTTSNDLDPLTQGFSDEFCAIHSRYAEVPLSHLQAHDEVNVLATTPKGGAYLLASKDRRLVFVTGHPEYDADTLDQEYKRDVAANLSPMLPENYYPNNDPANAPRNTWRGHGNLLMCNWLNHYVYQATPYDLAELSK
ncbi:homoserine O-acetyltransferase/O-succinyltransferase family protein [Algibacillus agarilyticus]|uniref:homoserine O-acetyltransferase/O-succinyltransferase family protein n=1 Tax=Algibacillus agarilyticus TaxID=2234133 RepID=UPI000DD0D7C6|nr:homoserine O-succinyltransferase [Algibacillus agarilyticus]